MSEFFDGYPEGAAIYREVERAVLALGEVSVRVTKSQVAFKRGKNFAYVWRPGMHLKSDVPAVVSFALPRELTSERFKEVAHPAAKVWMHHVELRSPDEVDQELTDWLRQAWDEAA